jgi:hypothetical protein
MTLTNHILTGAAFAKFLPLPVAIPLAFASHFILDALPHFGFKTVEERIRHVRLFRAIIVADIVATAAISCWLVKGGHSRWLLVGFAAYAPDIWWIYRFTVEEKFGKRIPTAGNRFIQFHRSIQRYEREWGIGVELIYGFVAYSLIR